MATVWRGRDRELRRLVAIKRLHPHIAAHSEAAVRFKHEALSAASLAHPGVVTVFDAGEDATGPYIVMEFVEGETLADLLRRKGRLSPDQAADIARQAAESLHHAHERGLIHRDVKPGNILLDPLGRVKLADFGIARSVEMSDRLTGTNTVLGTAAYLAPEQAAGNPATPASDIYALGVVLYEMLTGSVPFRGESPVAVALAHQTAEPERPGNLADVPADLEMVVLRALEKDPDRRFASAQLLAGELERWSALRAVEEGFSTPASPGPAEETAPLAPVRHRTPTTVLPRADRPARPKTYLPWALLGVLGGLLLAGLALRPTGREAPTTTAQLTTTIPVQTTVESPDLAPTTSGLTVEEAFQDLSNTIEHRMQTGQIERQVGNKLRKLADEARREWLDDNREKARDKLGELEEKTREAAEEEQITPPAIADEILERTDALRELIGPSEDEDDGDG